MQFLCEMLCCAGRRYNFLVYIQHCDKIMNHRIGQLFFAGCCLWSVGNLTHSAADGIGGVNLTRIGATLNYLISSCYGQLHSGGTLRHKGIE